MVVRQSLPPRLLRKGFIAATVLGATGALVYGGMLGYLYASQERLLFRATPLPADYQFRFTQPFEEIRVPVAGAVLDALYFPQQDSRGLVFFLHGNAGNLETWTTGLDFYKRVGYDLFMLDYRGYGKSTGGVRSEAELHDDVRAAWEAIAPRYRGKPIVIYGRSLGTGLAAALARDVNPALLILVSPYESLTAAAKRAYPLAPEWLLKYPLQTDAVIGDVKSPVMLLHGRGDTLIPYSDSERLASRVHAPVELVLIDGAGHNDIHRFPAYLEAIAARLEQLPKP
jgi:alpha-beta hydrolase superfamily lysophospholipase